MGLCRVGNGWVFEVTNMSDLYCVGTEWVSELTSVAGAMVVLVYDGDVLGAGMDVNVDVQCTGVDYIGMY